MPILQTALGAHISVDTKTCTIGGTHWFSDLIFDPDIEQVTDVLFESLIQALSHQAVNPLFLLVISNAIFHGRLFGRRHKDDEHRSQHYNRAGILAKQNPGLLFGSGVKLR
jgi:hypothetical protein